MTDLLPSPLLRRLARPVVAALFTLLAGCATLPPAEPFKLRIVHINDHHANLEPQRGFDLTVEGLLTRVELGGMPRVVSAMRQLDDGRPLLKIHAGDALTGTLFHTVFGGAADAQVMNLGCFDTFTLGNHEFDEGDAALRRFLDALRADGRCGTAVLSANVRPAAGTPLAPGGGPALLQPYVVRSVGGVRVGIVGLTIKGKTLASSQPLPSTVFLEEVDAAAEAVAALRAQRVRHIVLATHLGLQNDLALVRRLPEVDVVVGGDSHTLLASPGLAESGLKPAGPYPLQATNADGAPVCVVQAWEYAKAVGALDVTFDATGRVTACGGRLVLPIGETVQRQDAAGRWAALPAPEARAVRDILARSPEWQVLPPDPAAEAVVAGHARQLGERLRERLGEAPAGLCHERVPGGTPSSGCGPQGSDTAQVVAQAFLQASRRAHFALQNAGGVRTSIPQGTLSYDTAYRVLPFANTLVEMELTGAEVAAMLEDAVSFHRDPVNGVRGSDGSHPYAAGLRWSLDLNQPRGRRFTALEVRDRATGRWLPLQPEGRYVVMTNDYIAGGKDGYATLGRVHADPTRWVDTGLYYTQTFVDFIRAHGALRPVPPDEYSHRLPPSAR
ncbi:MAG: 5'-nucleotidase C-terminal domain-containing protein [Aquincola tertiaricarbonis]